MQIDYLFQEQMKVDAYKCGYAIQHRKFKDKLSQQMEFAELKKKYGV